MTRLDVHLDGTDLQTRETFHARFAQALAFPPFYGANMDAWIDCMSALGAPDEGLSGHAARDLGVVAIRIANVNTVKSAAPDIWAELVDCTAIVNARMLGSNGTPLIALAYEE